MQHAQTLSPSYVVVVATTQDTETVCFFVLCNTMNVIFILLAVVVRIARLSVCLFFLLVMLRKFRFYSCIFFFFLYEYLGKHNNRTAENLLV